MSAIFIYNYTFRTLEDAHTIVLLNTNMLVNNINMENYQKAVDLLNTRSINPMIPGQLRNIFDYVAIPTNTSKSSSPSHANP